MLSSVCRCAIIDITTWSSNDTFGAGKPKSGADPRLAELNRFLRRHEFFARSSFAKFTSSQRRAFERDVYFFAETLNLSEKVAKKELSKARKFCRENLSNSDDSAWFGEIDGSSEISVSLGSRPDGPTKINSTNATPSLLQSLPIDGERQPGKMPLGFSESELDSKLRPRRPGSQTFSNDKASKKRKLEQADAGDHEPKQKTVKCDKTRRAKKAKLQVSEAGDRDQVQTITQASTFPAKRPAPMVESEVARPRKKRKRRKKAAKAQCSDEVISQPDLEVSKKVEDFPNNISTASREEPVNTYPPKSSETIEPGLENSSEAPAEFLNDEEATRSSQELRLDGAKQSLETNEILKLQPKEAKEARRRATPEGNSVREECDAKPPEFRSSPDGQDLQAKTTSQAEQDLHSPQDFHSPMIQSVGQLLMRRCLNTMRFFTAKGNGRLTLDP